MNSPAMNWVKAGLQTLWFLAHAGLALYLLIDSELKGTKAADKHVLKRTHLVPMYRPLLDVIDSRKTRNLLQISVVDMDDMEMFSPIYYNKNPPVPAVNVPHGKYILKADGVPITGYAFYHNISGVPLELQRDYGAMAPNLRHCMYKMKKPSDKDKYSKMSEMEIYEQSVKEGFFKQGSNLLRICTENSADTMVMAVSDKDKNEQIPFVRVYPWFSLILCEWIISALSLININLHQVFGTQTARMIYIGQRSVATAWNIVFAVFSITWFMKDEIDNITFGLSFPLVLFVTAIVWWDIRRDEKAIAVIKRIRDGVIRNNSRQNAPAKYVWDWNTVQYTQVRHPDWENNIDNSTDEANSVGNTLEEEKWRYYEYAITYPLMLLAVIPIIMEDADTKIYLLSMFSCMISFVCFGAIVEQVQRINENSGNNKWLQAYAVQTGILAGVSSFVGVLIILLDAVQMHKGSNIGGWDKFLAWGFFVMFLSFLVIFVLFYLFANATTNRWIYLNVLDLHSLVFRYTIILVMTIHVFNRFPKAEHAYDINMKYLL